MSSRFQSDRTVRIELTEGDWVEVLESIGWTEFEPIQALFKTKPTSAIIELLKLVVKKWNFKDGEKEVEVCPDTIARINLRTLEEISSPLMKLYLPEKKSSTPSVPELPEKTGESTATTNS